MNNEIHILLNNLLKNKNIIYNFLKDEKAIYDYIKFDINYYINNQHQISNFKKDFLSKYNTDIKSYNELGYNAYGCIVVDNDYQYQILHCSSSDQIYFIKEKKHSNHIFLYSYNSLNNSLMQKEHEALDIFASLLTNGDILYSCNQIDRIEQKHFVAEIKDNKFVQIDNYSILKNFIMKQEYAVIDILETYYDISSYIPELSLVDLYKNYVASSEYKNTFYDCFYNNMDTFKNFLENLYIVNNKLSYNFFSLQNYNSVIIDTEKIQFLENLEKYIKEESNGFMTCEDLYFVIRNFNNKNKTNIFKI